MFQAITLGPGLEPALSWQSASPGPSAAKRSTILGGMDRVSPSSLVGMREGTKECHGVQYCLCMVPYYIHSGDLRLAKLAVVSKMEMQEIWKCTNGGNIPDFFSLNKSKILSGISCRFLYAGVQINKHTTEGQRGEKWPTYLLETSGPNFTVVLEFVIYSLIYLLKKTLYVAVCLFKCVARQPTLLCLQLHSLFTAAWKSKRPMINPEKQSKKSIRGEKQAEHANSREKSCKASRYEKTASCHIIVYDFYLF